jgi:hypothetical protein
MDSAPCSGAFDLAFSIHSSKESSDEGFDIEKNFISELIGSFNFRKLNSIYLNKIGLMYFAKNSRVLNTLNKAEQTRGKKYFVDRTQNIPFVPYNDCPLSKALSKVRDRLFESKASMPTPRTLILFTEGSNDEGVQSSIDEARLLKNEGVEIIVIGIGSKTNLQELRSIASKANSEYVYQVPDHRSLFSVIVDLNQKICTSNKRISLNSVDSLTLIDNDYRYFEMSLSGQELIEVEIVEKVGSVNFFYSFSFKTPLFETSETAKQITKTSSGRDTISTYLVMVPNGATVLYFTIEGKKNINEFTLSLKPFDF